MENFNDVYKAMFQPNSNLRSAFSPSTWEKIRELHNAMRCKDMGKGIFTHNCQGDEYFGSAPNFDSWGEGSPTPPNK